MRGNKSPVPPVTAASYGVLNQRLRNNRLTSITIPDSVTVIEESSFESNHILTIVSIGANVDLLGHLDAFGAGTRGGCRNIYNQNGRRAGTLTASGPWHTITWAFTPR